MAAPHVGLTSDWVIAFKLKLGAILTGVDPSQIHITQRFYAGGSGSVRGYGYNVLGPLSPKGVLLGGDAIMEASSELRFPLTGDLEGVLFVDTGNAFKKSFKVSGQDLYTGAGFGVRYKTPVGPIGLDLAWKLKKYPLDPLALPFLLLHRILLLAGTSTGSSGLPYIEEPGDAGCGVISLAHGLG